MTTKRSRWIRSALLATMLATALVGGDHARAGEPPAAAPPADVSAEVGRLFDAAQAAFAKKDYQASYEAYRAAWALQKSYDIAGNLGNVELKLGKLRDAAEHLSFALRSFPPTGEPKQRKAIAAKLDGVLPKVGRVRVRVSVDGATVLLNGAVVGTSPLAEEVFVEPGASTIEAKREGYEDARATVQGVAGGSQEITLAPVLKQVSGGAGGPAQAAGVSGAGGAGGVASRPTGDAGASAPAPEERSVMPAIMIGAVGGVALVGGLVMIGVAESKRSDAEALSAETGHACPVDAASLQGKCADLADTASSADTFGNVGIGGLVLAGAAAAGVAAYLLWPAPPETGTSTRAAVRVRAAPVVGAQSGGVVVRGSW